MQPTDSEDTDDREVPEEFAAAWANVLLDLNEKQSEPAPNQEDGSNPKTQEQPCESTSKPTPK
jgi:hypothetical protein